MAGSEINSVVTEVKVAPKIAEPVTDTVPSKTALSVVNDAVAPGSEAKWVAVSILRASKLKELLGDKLLKVSVDDQAPPTLRYSQSAIALRVMLVAVFDANDGAAGAVCDAFVTVAVGAELALPSQFAALTVTVIVLPMSDWVKV